MACSSGLQPGCWGQVRRVWLVRMVEVLQLPGAQVPRGLSRGLSSSAPQEASTGHIPLPAPNCGGGGAGEAGSATSGKQPERIARSQKTALPLRTTTPGAHWREMGSWKGKTALPARQPPSWLPGSKVTGLHGRRPTALWPPLLPQHSLSVHTALRDPSPPPSSLPPEGIPPHLPVPQTQTTLLKIEPLYWYL